MAVFAIVCLLTAAPASAQPAPLQPYLLAGVGSYVKFSESRFGWNGGAGVRHGAGPIQLFAELRYHRVTTRFEEASTMNAFLPVSVGVVFGLLVTPLAAAAAAAQVTAELHTSPRARIVAPADGQPRILADGRVILLKVGPSTTGAGYLFLGAEDLPPGTGVPRHRHELDEEVLIVQRGTVTVELDDKASAAPAGSVVYLPPRTWVRITNMSADTAAIMFVFPRGAVERCFQFIGRAPEETRPPARTDAERAEERHSCQMTYR